MDQVNETKQEEINWADIKCDEDDDRLESEILSFDYNQLSNHN